MIKSIKVQFTIEIVPFDNGEEHYLLTFTAPSGVTSQIRAQNRDKLISLVNENIQWMMANI